MSHDRSFCHGLPSLTAHIPDWMDEAFGSDSLLAMLDEAGSPVNVVAAQPFFDNVAALKGVATDHQLDFEVYFARKANKCLKFVEAAVEIGCGVDTASFDELSQALAVGVPSSKLVCTAAVKNEPLVELCIQSGVPICVDNADELAVIVGVSERSGLLAEVVMRISGFEVGGTKLWSRFGVDVEDVLEFAGTIPREHVNLTGLQFHLDGYSAEERVVGAFRCLHLIDQLRANGFDVQSLDIGGGFPVCYLESEAEWDSFWDVHSQSLTSDEAAVTFRGHRLGRHVVDGTVSGKPNVYPYWQNLVGADWFRKIVSAKNRGESLAAGVRKRRLQLRCEPGRFLLDRCGFTASQVEFTKIASSGDTLVGLAMNRTQCRTGSDDFLVDPIVVQKTGGRDSRVSSEGYLVGAYCTESELISLRRLRFPRGINRGDIVIFANTAGYFMHFLESRSHQMPLAANYIWNGATLSRPTRDRIDNDHNV